MLRQVSNLFVKCMILCTQDGESDCNDGSQQAVLSPSSSSIGLQANLTDQQLQTALKVRHCSFSHTTVPLCMA